MAFLFTLAPKKGRVRRRKEMKMAYGEMKHQEYLEALSRATQKEIALAERAVREHLYERGYSFAALIVEIVGKRKRGPANP